MLTRFLLSAAFVFFGCGVVLGQTWPLNVCSYSSNMPFANSQDRGIEDKIATILAAELGAHIVKVPVDPPFPDIQKHMLARGDCDVVMAVNDGQAGFLTTVTYYRSIYAFLYNPDRIPPIDHLDDSALRNYRIGVLRARGSGISPVTQALAVRDLIPNQVTYLTDAREPDPLLALPAAVAAGEIDVAILWGPVAGYAARESGGQLTAVPVQPEIDIPWNVMYLNIAIGVRPGDEALRDELNLAIVRRWGEIQAVLAEFEVPLLPLVAPQESK